MEKHREWIANGRPRTGVTFPILNGLEPTTDSCTMKVLEEVGELMQLIGKGQGKSGEKKLFSDGEWATNTVAEALDTAQAATTMAHTISKEYGLNLGAMIELHKMKLIERGYLK